MDTTSEAAAADTSEPGIYLHRAVRADQLLDGLAELLDAAPLDPFVSELISVPTPGVERWLGQALSTRLGVAAGIEFIPFSSWMSRLWSAASMELLDCSDPTAARSADPWQPDQLVWAVLAEIDAAAGQPWALPVTRHVRTGDSPQPDNPEPDNPVPDNPRADDSRPDGAESSAGRRFLTARRIAGLFHRYSRERPEMTLSWLTGSDVDDQGEPLAKRHRWQPALWRAVRRSVGVPAPAERIEHVIGVLADPTGPGRLAGVELPSRLSIFGLNRLDALDRVVLQALARTRPVHLWLAHPSPGRWDRLADSDQPEVSAPHPLVTQLGRDVIQFQQVLGSFDTECRQLRVPVPQFPRDTVLGRLQNAIASDTANPTQPAPTPLPGSGDHSLQIHACHGPDRQVEVLRELVCTVLEEDPELEPRDIMIMTADLPRFAPLVAAAFDASGTPIASGDQSTSEHSSGRLHPGRRLRIRIADQSLTQVNPMLSLLERLLELVHARISASDLLDLCASPPVAAKFGFTADDVERIDELVRRSGVRWGLDAAHRADFKLSGFTQNTIAAGLDRMLLGVAWSERQHHHLGLVLPLEDVQSSDVERVGRLAEVADRLRHVLRSFAAEDGPIPGRLELAEWVSALQRAIELLCAPEPGESWQLGHAWSTLHSLLGDDSRSAATTGSVNSATLDLGDIRALLAEALAGRPARANFRTGSLTLSSLAPMRSVPHRVIFLLGMDDQVFPRDHARDGDDLLTEHPRVGDRDPRSEDRQLLLDAVMAAQDRLVVIYSGRDPRTNTVRPPSVPIGELIDAAAAVTPTADGSDPRDHLVVQHPLQPYDPRNFTAEAPIRTFDRTALAAARASVQPRTPSPPAFSREPLPPPAPEPELELSALQRFYRHPVKAFLRERGRWLPPQDEEDEFTADDIPMQLDGLQQWQIGDRLLAARRLGIGETELRAAEWRRGELPPRKLGATVLGGVLERVEQVRAAAAQWTEMPRQEVDIRASGDGWTLTGTATQVHGQQLVTVSYSRPNASHWLAAWWELLALTCTHPEVEWRAVVVGRDSPPAVFGPVSGEFARLVLDDALALRRTGLTAPLPLPVKAAYSYARQRDRDSSPRAALSKAASYWDYESDSLWTQFWGPSLGDIAAEPAIDAERRGAEAEPSRFGTLARRIFVPLLARSQGVR